MIKFQKKLDVMRQMLDNLSKIVSSKLSIFQNYKIEYEKLLSDFSILSHNFNRETFNLKGLNYYLLEKKIQLEKQNIYKNILNIPSNGLFALEPSIYVKKNSNFVFKLINPSEEINIAKWKVTVSPDNPEIILSLKNSLPSSFIDLELGITNHDDDFEIGLRLKCK